MCPPVAPPPERSLQEPCGPPSQTRAVRRRPPTPALSRGAALAKGCAVCGVHCGRSPALPSAHSPRLAQRDPHGWCSPTRCAPVALCMCACLSVTHCPVQAGAGEACLRVHAGAVVLKAQPLTRMAVHRRRRGEGVLPPGTPPPPPPDQSDHSGKNEMYNRENLVGHFWYTNFWVPDLPPPPSHTSLP